MPDTLFLRLEGPLQSWGERGRWSVRDTADEPTKSGVIGLVACALGYNQDGQLRSLSEQTRMGVRCDLPGVRLTDYHTIGGGYDEPTLLTAAGKLKKSSSGPHTELSHRDYLAGASFLVVLQADASLIQQMAHALQHPVWPIYLGRKSCPPSQPIFSGTGDFSDLEDALEHGPWSDSVPPPPEHTLRGVIECSPAEGVRRRDAILSCSRRLFGPRYTKDVMLDVSSVFGREQEEES